jgi:DNA-binding GntR family transcriptional regulator
MAAVSDDELSREELRAFLQRIEDPEASATNLQIKALDREFYEIICRMADCALAELLIQAGAQMFAEESAADLFIPPTGLQFWRDNRLKLTGALLDQNVELVRIFARSLNRYLAARVASIQDG